MQWAADGGARPENAGKPGEGDLASPGEITPEEPQDRKPARWCRVCGESARQRIDPDVPYPRARSAVHAATGEEEGPDGYVLVLTDENPELRAIADKIEAEYDGIVTISVRFGWFRADWAHLPPGTVAAHITADDEESLRGQLDAAVRRRETGG